MRRMSIILCHSITNTIHAQTPVWPDLEFQELIEKHNKQNEIFGLMSTYVSLFVRFIIHKIGIMIVPVL